MIKEGLAKEVTLSESLRIMDTPGVGDNKNMEEQNMLALYEELAKPEFEISCIVLVIRFPTLVTDAYKSNLRFYKRIFPQVNCTRIHRYSPSLGIPYQCSGRINFCWTENHGSQ